MGLNLKETELSLGLPGGIISNGPNTNGKRGFSETLDLITKHSSSCVDDDEIIISSPNNNNSNNKKEEEELDAAAAVPPPTKPPAAKAQVVGWPPVRSFRKNMISGAGMVKVSMDGAPYLRKVDLKMYSTYQQLSDALAKMFSNHGRQQQGGMIDFMKESKLVEELSTSSEYVHTYEDKDGDWMLVGDVPWEMFVDSCKRLRIMKGSEAIGLAPRAMEKLCKNKS